MPARNSVPTLKELAIRKIAWPAALRKVNQIPHMPGSKRESTVANHQAMTTLMNFFRRGGNHKATAGMEKLVDMVEILVNAWIRLSDYYTTRLDEIKTISYMFGSNTLEKLDFLHEGFTLKDGTDISQFAGVIPTAVPPQKINPYTWQAIVTLLKNSGNAESLKTLTIFFGLTSQASAVSGYHFSKTFAVLPNLTKVVVHGAANDALMLALGMSCNVLKYLDVRGSDVTERGVVQLLLYRSTDTKKFSANAKFTFPATFLRPVTETLEYLDISTVRKEGLLLDQDRVVRYSCPKIRGTPQRVFYTPEGVTRFRCVLNQGRDLNEIKNKVLSSTRTKLADTIVEITEEMFTCYQGYCSITGVELRVNSTGEESSVLYFHRDLVVAEVIFSELSIVNLMSYTSSIMEFISIEALTDLAPNITQIKASIRGILSEDHFPKQLKAITMPAAYELDTLKTILRFCKKVAYFEVREVLMAPGLINDKDLEEMIDTGCERLESFRLLFLTSIELVPGLKLLTIHCPNLKIIGDLKKWGIPLTTLSRFSLNVNVHNIDLTFEHDGLLYNPNTPCREFYR